MITDEELAELERLEKEATRGPWEDEPLTGGGAWIWGSKEARDAETLNVSGYVAETRIYADVALICAARNALPALIAELRAARKTIILLNAHIAYMESFPR